MLVEFLHQLELGWKGECTPQPLPYILQRSVATAVNWDGVMWMPRMETNMNPHCRTP